jgi:hypothetical protein
MDEVSHQDDETMEQLHAHPPKLFSTCSCFQPETSIPVGSFPWRRSHFETPQPNNQRGDTWRGHGKTQDTQDSSSSIRIPTTCCLSCETTAEGSPVLAGSSSRQVAGPVTKRADDLLSQRKGSLLQPMCSLSWLESEVMFVYLG